MYLYIYIRIDIHTPVLSTSPILSPPEFSVVICTVLPHELPLYHGPDIAGTGTRSRISRDPKTTTPPFRVTRHAVCCASCPYAETRLFAVESELLRCLTGAAAAVSLITTMLSSADQGRGTSLLLGLMTYSPSSDQPINTWFRI